MTYAENRYRIVESHDRNTTVKTFATIEQAQAFTRRQPGLEMQMAVEAEDGTVFEWQRTCLSQSPTRFATRLR